MFGLDALFINYVIWLLKMKHATESSEKALFPEIIRFSKALGWESSLDFVWSLVARLLVHFIMMGRDFSYLLFFIKAR